MDRLINKFLRGLYHIHRERFLDFAVADFYEAIPKKVSEPAITILEEKRKLIDDWILFQAYAIQRRIPRSSKGVDTTFGMLLQLRLMRHMISGGSLTMTEAEEGLLPASKAREDREREEEKRKASEGVEAFLRKGAPAPAKESPQVTEESKEE